jgi:hypothetical protein
MYVRSLKITPSTVDSRTTADYSTKQKINKIKIVKFRKMTKKRTPKLQARK